MFSQGVDVGPAVLDKKLDHFEVPVEAGPVKRSHLGFLGDGHLQDLRLLLNKLLDFVILLSLDVVEHVLAGSICAFDGPHSS